MPAATKSATKQTAAAKAKANRAKKATENADIKADHKAKAAAIKDEKATAAKAAAKADAAAAKPARDRSRWNDATGKAIEKGDTVKHDGKAIGTAAYFHTHEI